MGYVWKLEDSYSNVVPPPRGAPGITSGYTTASDAKSTTYKKNNNTNSSS
uniref:Uncharacterized protein n=1 Tax=Amphimedon queenslandica TaxID=400682 RepID=A0A1X7VGU6_AMPQE